MCLSKALSMAFAPPFVFGFPFIISFADAVQGTFCIGGRGIRPEPILPGTDVVAVFHAGMAEAPIELAVSVDAHRVTVPPARRRRHRYGADQQVHSPSRLSVSTVYYRCGST